ncbi:MAG: hypothetical protein AB7G47_12250 [Mycolicibacterium sp.]|uniref:hypothetical protein n=1 Tax=Mycolicibacterium sp. TaxID=2320850 RepID=UPI003D14A263
MNGLTVLLWLCVLVVILLAVPVAVRFAITWRTAMSALNSSQATFRKRYEFTTSTSVPRVIDAIEQRWGYTVPNGVPGFYVHDVIGRDEVTIRFGSQGRSLFTARIRFESFDSASGTLSFTDSDSMATMRDLGTKYAIEGIHPVEQLRSDYSDLIADLSPGAVLRELAVTNWSDQPSVTIRAKHEVRYAGGATREDAQRIGEAYFAPVAGVGAAGKCYLMVAGPAEDREISFPVGQGRWNYEFKVLWKRHRLERIAAAIGGRQVTMILLDFSFCERRRLRFEFNTEPVVDMGQDQYVFHAGGATREDAQRIGEALKEAGYFDGKIYGWPRPRVLSFANPDLVMIAGPVGHREISFYVHGGEWGDNSTVQRMRGLVERIAPAIGGKPVTMRLFTEGLDEKERLQLE